MSLSLSVAVEEKCRDLLIAGIKEAKGGFLRSVVSIRLASEHFAEAVVGNFGQKGKKPSWLTTHLISAFIRDRMSDIVETQREQLGVSAREVPALDEPEATADTIISAFRTLPW